MYAIRITKRLQQRLGTPSGDDAPTTTSLGDWFVGPFNLGHSRLLLCTSSAALLTVLIPARDLPGLPARLTTGVEQLLLALGAGVDVIARERDAMSAWRYAPTNSRSVLGTMNDMANLATAYLQGFTPDHLLLAELKMARAPCSPLGYDAPGKVALRLLTGESSA